LLSDLARLRGGIVCLLFYTYWKHPSSHKPTD
jgi:hypothetical protein